MVNNGDKCWLMFNNDMINHLLTITVMNGQ